jgi:hypothetical protein
VTGFKCCFIYRRERIKMFFMCRRDKFQILLHLQERQVSNAVSYAGVIGIKVLHVQERQVPNAASFTGERGFKCCFMCRSDRFQMLLHLQERQV